MDRIGHQKEFLDDTSDSYSIGHRRRLTFTNERVSEAERESNEIASPKPVNEMDVPDYLLNLDILTDEERSYAQEIQNWTSDQIESVFDCTYNENECLENAISSRDIFRSIHELQGIQNQTQLIARPDEIALPPKAKGDKPLTLVLDLDETLIRADESLEKWDREEVISIFNEKTNRYEEFVVRIRYRPYLFNFLREVKEYYEIVVFTAAIKEYAETIVHWLNETCNCIQYIRYRDHNTYFPDYPLAYYKDLSRLGRDMSKIFIIDNSPMVYAFNKDNAIPIKSWNFEEDDKELFFLASMLTQIANQCRKDVRPLLRSTYHLEDLISNGDISR